MADKKYKILQDNRRYGEMEVEWENGVRLILTDAKNIYHVSRHPISRIYP